MKRLYTIGVIAVQLLASLGCGHRTYTLHLNPRVGESYSYKTTISSGNRSLETASVLRVSSVAADSIVVDSRVLKIKAVEDGRERSPSELASITKIVTVMTVSRSGHLARTQVQGASPAETEAIAQQGGAGFTSFPQKPVKVGDSWTLETDFAGKKVFGTYKLVRVEELDGKEVAVLECLFDASAGIEQDGPITITLELATGMLLNSRATMRIEGAQCPSLRRGRKRVHELSR